MSLLQAIILGIVQGLTEFLPVSSSGHLAIMKNVFHLELDSGLIYDVLLHIATLIAVFVCFWPDIRRLIAEGFRILGDLFCNLGQYVRNLFSMEKRPYRRIVSTSYRRFVMLVIVSTIPTGLMGYLGADLVERAGESMLFVGLALITTAVMLFIADRCAPGTKKPAGVSYLNAAGIGVAQGFATLPGISRSGTTIAACLFSGFDRNFAVKYSFIMSIPAILGAAVLELKDFSAARVPRQEMLYYVAGMVAAMLVGFICIRLVQLLVKNKKFKIFGVYCMIAGALAILFQFGIIG